MALREILVYPNPVLKELSKPLNDFGPESQTLFNDMIETMYTDDGVGLAAPQIGVLKRVLIASPEMKPGKEYVIVNPEIVDSWGREVSTEGCLSFPGLAVDVARAKSILLRYQDREGQPHEVKIKDFFARIIQHEMDHLNGVLLIDKVPFEQRQSLLAEYQGG